MPKACGGLRFRDFAKFNLSLLVKHNWRLWTQLNYLLALVLEAHYFLHTDFLFSVLGSYPSLTWRSILVARSVLERGLGWRIGDGKSINIWTDPWLPGTVDGRIRCNSIHICYTLVANFLDKDCGTWNEVVVREVADAE